MKRKDLAVWESEFGGTTAEGVIKRVINKYNPSSEELTRVVSRGRGGVKKTDLAASEDVDKSQPVDVAVKLPVAASDEDDGVFKGTTNDVGARICAESTDNHAAPEESATKQKKGPGVMIFLDPESDVFSIFLLLSVLD